jgi:hypothetical protein
MNNQKTRYMGQVACMTDMRNIHKILVRKPEGKSPLQRYRHRWDNTIMYLKKSGTMMWTVFI